MKKIVEKIKSSKRLILGILIGALTINVIEFVVTLAANSVSSDIVLYDSSTGKKNVKDAIDELYTMASTHCPDGYTCSNGCHLIDGTGENVGDIIECGTEIFYVISNNGTNIKMLAKYNIAKKTGLQSADAVNSIGGPGGPPTIVDAITFSSTLYWSDNISKYPAFVYNNQSSLYSYAEDYKTKLKKLNVNVIDASLISIEDLNNLGCRYPSCSDAPAWVSTSSNYWTGSAYDKENIFTLANGKLSTSAAPNIYAACFRPVITIPASSL